MNLLYNPNMGTSSISASTANIQIAARLQAMTAERGPRSRSHTPVLPEGLEEARTLDKNRGNLILNMCLALLKVSLLMAGGEARPLRERTRTRSTAGRGGRYLEDHPSEEVVK